MEVKKVKSLRERDAGGGFGGHKVQVVRWVRYWAVQLLIGLHSRYAQAEGRLRLAQRFDLSLVLLSFLNSLCSCFFFFFCQFDCICNCEFWGLFGWLCQYECLNFVFGQKEFSLLGKESVELNLKQFSTSWNW